MTVSIGPLQPQEVPVFCELFQRVFSVGITPAQRDWKYAQGPRLGSLSLVAREGTGALVGHVGALIFPGVCQGRALPMAQVCDIMVDMRARGGLEAGGVYGRLMQALQAQLFRAHPDVLAYGFAGLRPYRLGERMGLYRSGQPCRMGLWQGPAQPAMPWRLSARRFEWAHPAWARVSARLWARLGGQGPQPQVARTPQYLGWRYAAHPSHQYQPWLLQRWARAQGWVITRAMPDGSLCLVDQLLPPGVAPQDAAAAVAAGLEARGMQGGGSAATPPPIGSWWMQTEASARLEPMMGGEVVVNPRSGPRPLPRFQPGDTDVF
jgi:hypothetical protein